MYKAREIAQFFVLRGINEDNPLTAMKLQKLVYFAHGLYLLETDDPLIAEEFQAWQFGPVVPSLYRSYAYFKGGPIDSESALSVLGLLIRDIPPLNEKAESIINGTWDALKDIHPIQLSNWTHRPDSAWSRIYNPVAKDLVIPNSEIKKDLQRFVNEASGRANGISAL
jgi:uncharacterized phage-associated protein